MDTYNLYLDESEVTNKNNHKTFCMAGIIINRDDISELETKVNAIKHSIWGDKCGEYILHEKDIKYANNTSNRNKLNKIPEEYHIFKQNSKMKYLYSELAKIYKLDILTVVGACVRLTDLEKHFTKEIVADDYLMSIQIILENFCQFLSNRNAKGYVYYESRQNPLDERTSMLFHNVKALGTIL